LDVTHHKQRATGHTELHSHAPDEILAHSVNVSTLAPGTTIADMLSEMIEAIATCMTIARTQDVASARATPNSALGTTSILMISFL